MRRKLAVVVVCIAAVVIVILLFSNGNGGGRNSSPGQTLVITQDGKVTLVPQHRDGWSVTVSQSNVVTNATARPR